AWPPTARGKRGARPCASPASRGNWWRRWPEAAVMTEVSMARRISKSGVHLASDTWRQGKEGRNRMAGHRLTSKALVLVALLVAAAGAGAASIKISCGAVGQEFDLCKSA